MTISISNLTANSAASPGTVVGVLTALDASGTVIPCNFTLTKNSAGYFAISASNLVTTWSKPPVPGFYSVRIHGNGTSTKFSGNARFTITVNAAAPPPPPPPPPPPVVPLISFNPPNPAIPSTTPKGAVVAAVVVTMSDGSAFTGTLGFGPPNFDDGGTFAISGSNLIINPAGPGIGPDGGSIQYCTVVATQ